MAAVIKIPRQHTSKDPETNQRRAPWSRDWCGPMREAVVACVWLVAVSVVLALLTCLTISRGFSFCSYYSGRQLQCAPYTHTGPVKARLSLLLQVLINPGKLECEVSGCSSQSVSVGGIITTLCVASLLPADGDGRAAHHDQPRLAPQPLPPPRGRAAPEAGLAAGGRLQAAGLAHVHGGVQVSCDWLLVAGADL